jgi:prepilin-type N-terminal cleavage/methylation domain-containing protein
MVKSNKKGFTLIELLVVIAIIGLLSTLAVVALNSARQKSRDSKRVADTKQVQTALELYFADNNGYPPGSSLVLGGASAGCLGGNGFQASGGCTGTTYMGLVPSAPTPPDGNCDTSSNPYTYNQGTNGTDYSIAFCLGGTVGDLSAGGRTATSAGIQ